MGWFRKKAQPKDEHPMQETWDELGEYGKWPISPHTGLPYDPKLIDYGFPLGQSGVVYPPVPRVDRRLIGKDQR